jgi:NAD(P) transhydrogenase subunit alpha
MKIGAPGEIFAGEAQVGMTPDSAVALRNLGHTCFVEARAAAGISDAAYAAAWVSIVPGGRGTFTDASSAASWRHSLRIA